jgi:hypothetical protein
VVTVAVAAAVDVVAVAASPRCAQQRPEGCGQRIDNRAGEGVAARYQARPSREGWQDQEHGGDVRSAHGRHDGQNSD